MLVAARLVLWLVLAWYCALAASACFRRACASSSDAALRADSSRVAIDSTFCTTAPPLLPLLWQASARARTGGDGGEGRGGELMSARSCGGERIRRVLGARRSSAHQQACSSHEAHGAAPEAPDAPRVRRRAAAHVGAGAWTAKHESGWASSSSKPDSGVAARACAASATASSAATGRRGGPPRQPRLRAMRVWAARVPRAAPARGDGDRRALYAG